MYIIIQEGVISEFIGLSGLRREIKKLSEARAILNAVRYFCASGGLAELVDCTGLENRRAERYRGFESLSLRSKALVTTSAFFVSLNDLACGHALLDSTYF